LRSGVKRNGRGEGPPFSTAEFTRSCFAQVRGGQGEEGILKFLSITEKWVFVGEIIEEEGKESLVEEGKASGGTSEK